jgi:hypothetical protein
MFGLSFTEVGVYLALAVLSPVGTTVAAGAFIVLIRPDHFLVRRRGLRRRIQSPPLGVLYVLGKNLAGAVLVVLGILLAVPGVPGQGILTILVGLLMLDIPGKRRLELAIVRRPAVLRTINRLRARYQRAPLDVANARDSEPPSEPGN